MKNYKSKTVRLTIMLYLLMFAYAVFTVMTGTQLLVLLQEFDLTLSQGGIFTVVVNGGCMLGILISGFFLPRYNKNRLVMVSYLCFGLLLLLVGISVSYTGFLILLLLIGISMKFLDASINAAVSYMNPVHTGFYISLLHCSFAAGSFVGPMFTTFLMDRGYGWRKTYTFLGVICLVILVLFSVIQRNNKNILRDAGDEEETKVSYREFVKPEVACLMVILLCYCGHQIGINSWLPAYMQKDLGAGRTMANLSLSVFWVGLIAGRLVSAVLTTRIKVEVVLKYSNLLGSILLGMGIFSRNLMLTVIGVGCAGLFSGATIPLVITIGYAWFPKAQGKMSTILFMCIAGGAVIFPWLAGMVSENRGLYAGMLLNVACLWIGTAVAFVAGSLEKHQ